MNRILLGVNLDHVATVRQARGVSYPDPVEAASLAESAGADGITVHLRQDRRHIQDHDVFRLRERVTTKLNLEMAVTAELCAIATAVKPEDACIVPEKREELTTEGGLDAAGQMGHLRPVVGRLSNAGIRVSLFIDPDPRQIDAAVRLGVPVVELHTGTWANTTGSAAGEELVRLRQGARAAAAAGLQVNAGHGLRLDNTLPIASLPEVVELNIGHSIVARSILVGLGMAVREMRALLDQARPA